MGDQSEKSGIPQLAISIIPVQPDDIAALVRIHTAAFKADQFSNLMLLGRDENAHENMMQEAIQQWITDPKAKLMRAVNADGRVLGWSCWVLKEARPTTTTTTGARDSKDSSAKDAEASGGPRKENTDTAKAKAKDPTRVLGGLMYQDRVSMEDEHMKGKKTYMVLQALVTDPSYQRRGIASRLVETGLQEVDAAGLGCWTHASPSSYTVYERAGFREVGRNDYDLDEWAPGGKGGNRGWGRYTFRHMVRLARESK